jgi:hypothetical protein
MALQSNVYIDKINDIQTNTASAGHSITYLMNIIVVSSIHICMPKESKHTYGTTRIG